MLRLTTQYRTGTYNVSNSKGVYTYIYYNMYFVDTEQHRRPLIGYTPATTGLPTIYYTSAWHNNLLHNIIFKLIKSAENMMTQIPDRMSRKKKMPALWCL